MSNTMKTDYGNYSDSLRKGFHHEAISFFRRVDNEYHDIEKPRLSVLLSGTHGQLKTLIPSPENGLFSRFIHYTFPANSTWKDVWSRDTKYDFDSKLSKFGTHIYNLHKQLLINDGIQFTLTEEQESIFNELFVSQLNLGFKITGESFSASVKRMGLISFRIAMILSVIRMSENNNSPRKLVCTNDDFEASLIIGKSLLKHARFIYQQLPGDKKGKIKFEKQEVFYETLPNEFNADGYRKIANTVGINEKTSERYISDFVKFELLKRPAHNIYQKI